MLNWSSESNDQGAGGCTLWTPPGPNRTGNSRTQLKRDATSPMNLEKRVMPPNMPDVSSECSITVSFLNYASLTDAVLLGLASRFCGSVGLPSATADQPTRQSLTTRDRERLAARAALSLISPDPALSLRSDSDFGYCWLEDDLGGRISVSFAHTGSVAIAGLYSGPGSIGVDIESLSRVPGKALSGVCSAEELSLAEGFTTLDGFSVPNGLLLWTGKEAAAKATGLGMRLGLANFSVGLKPPFPVVVRESGPLLLEAARLQFRVSHGHLIAVCTSAARLVGTHGGKHFNLLTYPLS